MLRRAQRVSQSELAEACHLSLFQYQSIENSINSPTVVDLSHIARFFHIPIDFFFRSFHEADINFLTDCCGCEVEEHIAHELVQRYWQVFGKNQDRKKAIYTENFIDHGHFSHRFQLEFGVTAHGSHWDSTFDDNSAAALYFEQALMHPGAALLVVLEPKLPGAGRQITASIAKVTSRSFDNPCTVATHYNVTDLLAHAPLDTYKLKALVQRQVDEPVVLLPLVV